MSWFKKNKSDIVLICKKFKDLDCDVYIFGSALIKDTPNDLDILIVIKSSTNKESFYNLKNLTSHINNLKIHYLVLTTQELKEDLAILNNIKNNMLRI